MKKTLFSLLTVALAIGAQGFDLAHGWRISVGAAYNAPAKVNLKFAPVQLSGGNVLPGIQSGLSREEAMQKGWGRKTSGTRTEYTDDGKVFVDTEDYRKVAGGVEHGTWNVKVPMSSWDGDKFVLGSAEYAEVETTHEGNGVMRMRGEDETATPGVTVELSRNLYHNEEWHFGVDLAFVFSYFFRTDLYKSDAAARTVDRMSVKSGRYESSISPVSGTVEPDLSDDPGYYGAGTFYGPGPVFNDPVFLGPNEQLRTFSAVNTGSIHADGDYRDLEMMLLLKPYYDVFEWFRLYASIGLAVSRAEFDLDVNRIDNGLPYGYSRDYSQWDVYGIGGLGLLLRWNDFCLGCDFLARFLDRDLDINDETVRGSLRRGRWMFRCMLGYEF